jgi:hypothetical protein
MEERWTQIGVWIQFDSALSDQFGSCTLHRVVEGLKLKNSVPVILSEGYFKTVAFNFT